jgi:hypothetical protein
MWNGDRRQSPDQSKGQANLRAPDPPPPRNNPFSPRFDPPPPAGSITRSDPAEPGNIPEIKIIQVSLKSPVPPPVPQPAALAFQRRSPLKCIESTNALSPWTDRCPHRVPQALSPLDPPGHPAPTAFPNRTNRLPTPPSPTPPHPPSCHRPQHRKKCPPTARFSPNFAPFAPKTRPAHPG